MVSTGLIALDEIRDTAAAVLEPAADGDPMVFADAVEAVVPPALLLAWDDPWIEPGLYRPTMGPCLYTARLRVICIAARLDPGTGVDELERLVTYVLGRMRADTYTWALDQVNAPEQITQAGIDSLRTNVIYTVTTSI